MFLFYYLVALIKVSFNRFKLKKYSSEEIINYYENGLFEKSTEEVYLKFENWLMKKRIHNNDTIIFDIDETIISNYLQIKSVEFGYDLESWKKYVLKAEGEEIKFVKKMYKLSIEKNIKVIFLTGRSLNQCEATKKNLEKIGIVNYEKLLCSDAKFNFCSLLKSKIKIREQLAKDGYNIIATVGDQYFDFVGPKKGKVFRIPNILY